MVLTGYSVYVALCQPFCCLGIKIHIMCWQGCKMACLLSGIKAHKQLHLPGTKRFFFGM